MSRLTSAQLLDQFIQIEDSLRSLLNRNPYISDEIRSIQSRLSQAIFNLHLVDRELIFDAEEPVEIHLPPPFARARHVEPPSPLSTHIISMSAWTPMRIDEHPSEDDFGGSSLS